MVSDFTQNAGALSAVNADWNIQTWINQEDGSPYARQNVAANVYQFNDALGLKTSKVISVDAGTQTKYYRANIMA